METSVIKGNRAKRIVAIIMIVIGLPGALSYAAEGGNFMAIPFGILLAAGIDMLVGVCSSPKTTN